LPQKRYSKRCNTTEQTRPGFHLAKDGGSSNGQVCRHLYHADLPRLQALKRWLEASGIPYEERDLTDVTIMEEAKARTGVRVAPITFVGDEFFYGNVYQPAAEGYGGARPDSMTRKEKAYEYR